MKKLLFLIFPVLIFAGCSDTVSKKQCEIEKVESARQGFNLCLGLEGEEEIDWDQFDEVTKRIEEYQKKNPQ